MKMAEEDSAFDPLCIDVMNMILGHLKVEDILSFSQTARRFNSKTCILQRIIPNCECIRVRLNSDEAVIAEQGSVLKGNDLLHLKLPLLLPHKTLAFRVFFTFHAKGRFHSLRNINATVKNDKGIVVASSRDFPVVGARQYLSIKFLPRSEENYHLSCKIEREIRFEDWTTFFLEDIETESILYGYNNDYILKVIPPDQIDWKLIADSLSCEDIPLYIKRQAIQKKRDDDGSNLLHLSCVQRAPLCTCRLLFSIGGHESVLMKNYLGHTPLHTLAMNCPNQKYIVALIEVGKEDIIQAEDVNKCTAFQLACWKGQEKAIIPILKFGGNDLVMKKHSITGWSPLHFACACDKEVVEVIEILITNGGGNLIMARDNDGETVMHKASFKGNLATMKVLLQTGGTEIAKLESNGGKSPLDYAIEAGNKEAIQLLSVTN